MDNIYIIIIAMLLFALLATNEEAKGAELEKMGASVTVTVQVTFIDPATISEGPSLDQPIVESNREPELILDEDTGVAVVTYQ